MASDHRDTWVRGLHAAAGEDNIQPASRKPGRTIKGDALASPNSVSTCRTVEELQNSRVGRALMRDFLLEPVGAREITRRFCEKSGVTRKQIESSQRIKPIVTARHELFKMLYESGLTLGQIGRLFKKHHTTVLNGVRKAEARALSPAA